MSSMKSSPDLHDLGVAQLAAKLAAREVSSVEATQHFLARLAQDKLGAFLATNADVSLAQAKAADARLAAGERTPLLGVPLAHKDVFVTRDFPTTAGSKILENYRSPFDATVVKNLGIEGAGMVTLGKLNCDEFAMGSGNDNSAYKPVKNPWDLERIPGGSSGGSAAAVAARLVPAATGTDTGGSIRQPASLTGITGIKPTYGRCSRYGMVAFASSLDQAGPMARSALDCALLLSAMAGPDPDRDSTSLDLPATDYATDLIAASQDAARALPLKGLRIGLPTQFFGAGCAPDVLAAVRAALAEYEKLGATLVDVSLPLTELSIPVYYVIAPAEASSNLSRFDGVRYGHRAANYTDLNDMYKKSRSEGFGDEA
ncbi:MAG: Asp-tRNA(Asn)/Glu-tRNA(Gln) amidotransferase subunit GatA, partial [Polaromonas sp.]|nr:Asp-tRNA(Asn)/Glu-tRNA(Gln) amidotransferase subunit GatA [Polaromonas sp.]